VLLMVASECEEKAIVSRRLQEFLYGPDVVSKPRLHCGSYTERLMYANEVEKSHIERDSRLEMVKALAESQAQPSEAAKVCPHAQVGAFNVRRADAFNLRVSADGDWDGRGNFRGVVPLRAFSVARSVELEQLGEVNIRSKVFFDGGNVTAETIGRELESACDSLAQISNEVVGTRTFALATRYERTIFVSLSIAIQMYWSPHSAGVSPYKWASFV